MSSVTTFQNGQTLTSSALTIQQMDMIMQQLSCQMLGLTMNLSLQCNLLATSNKISTPLIAVNLAIGFLVSGEGIPDDTTITDLAGEGSALIITLSNEATVTAIELIYFSEPLTNTRVRIEWPTDGAPAFLKTEDVLFLRCVEVDDYYNKQRDETIAKQSETQLLKSRYYTRAWAVYYVAYGPNSFDSLRLIKSALLEDFSHDMLAANNLYLIVSLPNVVRIPELDDGQWWERSDLSIRLYEEVTETINAQSVASVPITVDSSLGTSQSVNVV